MYNVPTRGKLHTLYSAVDKERPVSKEDLEKLIENLNKKNPDQPFRRQDIENLLYKKRGFMIPHPQRKGYFLRSDSDTVSELSSKSENQARPLDLNICDFSKRLEDVPRQYEELGQRIANKLKQKERLEQELHHDQEKMKKLEEALELAGEFLRKLPDEENKY